MNNCYNTSTRENDNIYMRMIGNVPKNEDSSSDSEFSDNFDDRLDEEFNEILKGRKNQEKTKEVKSLRPSHSTTDNNWVPQNNHVPNSNEEIEEVKEKSSARSNSAPYTTSSKHGYSDNNRTNVDIKDDLLHSSKNAIVNNSVSENDRVLNVVKEKMMEEIPHHITTEDTISNVEKALPTVPETDGNIMHTEFDIDEEIISPVSGSSSSSINTILDSPAENVNGCSGTEIIQGINEENKSHVVDSSKPLSNAILNNTTENVSKRGDVEVANVVIEEVYGPLSTVPLIDVNVTQAEYDTDVPGSSDSTIKKILNNSSENANFYSASEIIQGIDKENASYVVDSSKPLTHTILNNTTEDEDVHGGDELVKEEERSQILYDSKNMSSMTSNDSVPKYNRVPDAVMEEVKEGIANHVVDMSNSPNEIGFRGNEQTQENATKEPTLIADNPSPIVRSTDDNVTRTKFSPNSNKEMEDIISPISHSSTSSIDTSPSSIETILDSSDDNVNGCGVTEIIAGIEGVNVPNIVEIVHHAVDFRGNEQMQGVERECSTSNENKSSPTVHSTDDIVTRTEFTPNGNKEMDDVISPVSHSSTSSIETILDSSDENTNGHDTTEILPEIKKDDTSDVVHSNKALDHTTMNNSIKNGTVRDGIESIIEVREENVAFVVNEPLSTPNKSITETEVSRLHAKHNAGIGKVENNSVTDTSYSEINNSVANDVDESKWTDIESDGTGYEEGNSYKYNSVTQADIDDNNWTDLESDENS